MRKVVVAIALLAFSASLFCAVPDLSRIKPLKIGVDHAGNLWAWDPAAATVAIIAPAGRRVDHAAPSGGSAIDVDLTWGVASIQDSGSNLRVTRWSSEQPVVSVALPNVATDVHWLDANHVAIATRFARDVIEIWQLSDGSREKVLAASSPIDTTTPGARFARTTLLGYDAPQNAILALDALSGVLSVYGRNDGRLIRTVDIGNPKRGEAEAWVAKLDASYKQQGKAFLPAVWAYPSMSVTPDGAVWISPSSENNAVQLVSVSRSGAVTRKTMHVASCPSVRFQLWQQQLVFFRDTQSASGQCVAVIKESGK